MNFTNNFGVCIFWYFLSICPPMPLQLKPSEFGCRLSLVSFILYELKKFQISDRSCQKAPTSSNLSPAYTWPAAVKCKIPIVSHILPVHTRPPPRVADGPPMLHASQLPQQRLQGTARQARRSWSSSARARFSSKASFRSLGKSAMPSFS